MKTKEKHISRLWDSLWINPIFTNLIKDSWKEIDEFSDADKTVKEAFIQNKGQEILNKMRLPKTLYPTICNCIENKKRINPPYENCHLHLNLVPSEPMYGAYIQINKHTTLTDLQDFWRNEIESIKHIQRVLKPEFNPPQIDPAHLRMYQLNLKGYSPDRISKMDQFEEYNLTPNGVSQLLVRIREKMKDIYKQLS